MEENLIKDAHICLSQKDIDFLDTLIQKKIVENRSKYIQQLLQQNKQTKKINCFIQIIKDVFSVFIGFLIMYGFFLFTADILFFILTLFFAGMLIIMFILSYIKNSGDYKLWQ